MPERDLWQAVLMAQIENAISASHIGSRDDTKVRTAEARHYLTTPSKDLETVCSLAGVDMEALIDRMQKRLADLAPVEIVPLRMGRKRADPKNARRIEYNGQCRTVAEWSDISGIPLKALHARITNGWEIADALTTSVRGRQRKAA